MRTERHEPTAQEHRRCTSEPEALQGGKSPEARPKKKQHEVSRAAKPAERIGQTEYQQSAGNATGSRARAATAATKGTRRQTTAGRRCSSTGRPENRRQSRGHGHEEKHATAIDTGSNHSWSTPRRQGQAPLNDLQRTAHNALDRPNGGQGRSRTTASQRPAPTPHQRMSPATRTEARGAPEPYPRHRPRGRQPPSAEDTDRTVKNHPAGYEAQSREQRSEHLADTESGTARRTEDALARSASKGVESHSR